MPWTKLDDGFHEHPKTVAMSDKAFRLFTCSLTYSSRHDLRGRLTRAHLAVLFRLTETTQAHVEELLELHSFDPDGSGVIIHGFDTYNPDQDELKRKRAEAGRAGGQMSGVARRSKNEANASEANEAKRSNGTTRGGNPEPEPLPGPKVKDSTARHPLSRGTRLENPFELPDEWREFAERERPHLDANVEGHKFADYWHAIPGSKGLKLDWFATWRNHVRGDLYGRGQPAMKNGRAPEPQTIHREFVLPEYLKA